MNLLKLAMPGVRLDFDEKTFRLYCEGKEVKPNVRTLGDLKPVLADAAFAEKITPSQAKRIQYYMFRGVEKTGDKKVFAKARVSFDVTVLPALDLGAEYNKTLGHYHALAKPSGEAYPEIYEVLEGQAFYLLQKKGAGGKLEDIIYCKAKKGDQILIPPGYGHVTVNAGRGALVMANLIAEQKSDYDDFIKRRGAALYVFRNGEIRKNKRYPLRTGLKPRVWRARRVWPNGLYSSFIENPGAFDFLTKPERVLFE